MNSTSFSGGEIIFWAMRAMATAPAVWELEGPIILGPSTSNTLINDMALPSFPFGFHGGQAPYSKPIIANKAVKVKGRAIKSPVPFPYPAISTFSSRPLKIPGTVSRSTPRSETISTTCRT